MIRSRNTPVMKILKFQMLKSINKPIGILIYFLIDVEESIRKIGLARRIENLDDKIIDRAHLLVKYMLLKMLRYPELITTLLNLLYNNYKTLYAPQVVDQDET